MEILDPEVVVPEAASAAIELFRLLADEVDPLLDERQRAVIAYALAASRSRG